MVLRNGVEHGDFVREAVSTDVDPDWYGQEITRDVQNGTDVDGSPLGWVTRRYTVVGLEPLGTGDRIRLRSEHGRDAWCTVRFVREQLGDKPAAPRAPRVRALDLGLG